MRRHGNPTKYSGGNILEKLISIHRKILRLV
jgi:hypothetical protein